MTPGIEIAREFPDTDRADHIRGWKSEGDYQNLHLQGRSGLLDILKLRPRKPPRLVKIDVAK
jgi:hypothetical protein